MSAKIHPLRPFRFSRPSNWTGAPKPRDWLLENLALKKTVMVFNGPGSVGKSLLMQQLMTCCAIGAEFLGNRVPRIRSYGWFAEDPRDEMERRQADINRYFAIEPPDTDGISITAADEMDNPVLFAAASTGDRGAHPTPQWLSLRAHVIEEGAQLVVIDNVALAFSGNANYPELVAAVMSELKRLAYDIDGVVALIQHPSQEGEASGSGQSGSRAWSNLARSRLYMTFPKEHNEDADEVCYERLIRTKKNNYGPRRGPMRVEWRDGVFVPVTVSGQSGGRLPTDQWIELRSRIAAVVRFMVGRGDRVSLTNGSPDHIAARLGKDPAWKMFGKPEITKAADSLVSEGKLVIVDVGKGTRARRLLRTPETTYAGEGEGAADPLRDPC